jgi:hypothetical protein
MTVCSRPTPSSVNVVYIHTYAKDGQAHANIFGQARLRLAGEERSFVE